MADDLVVLDDLGQASTDSAYARRARFFDTGNAFNLKSAPVPTYSFEAERDQAFDAATETALIPCDASEQMGIDVPATTPLVLAHYARIAAGESLEIVSRASTELYYVIDGAGRSTQDGDQIAWRTGDVFCFPGGRKGVHESLGGDALLWLVTNEPQLAFERFRPPSTEEALVQAVHYPVAAIEEQLSRACEKLLGQRTAGLAVIFSSEELEHRRSVSPTLTLAMNQLPPGGSQIPHRHNSVAVALVVDGPDAYSNVDAVRVDWAPYATMITPPGAVHSHQNEGHKTAMWLIVQDGGLYYHCRTLDFQYADEDS